VFDSLLMQYGDVALAEVKKTGIRTDTAPVLAILARLAPKYMRDTPEFLVKRQVQYLKLLVSFPQLVEASALLQGLALMCIPHAAAAACNCAGASASQCLWFQSLDSPCMRLSP